MNTVPRLKKLALVYSASPPWKPQRLSQKSGSSSRLTEAIAEAGMLRMESVFFGALMHNRDANAIVNELNAMIKT